MPKVPGSETAEDLISVCELPTNVAPATSEEVKVWVMLNGLMSEIGPVLWCAKASASNAAVKLNVSMLVPGAEVGVVAPWVLVGSSKKLYAKVLPMPCWTVPEAEVLKLVVGR
jgi:hypothetical protein